MSTSIRKSNFINKKTKMAGGDWKGMFKGIQENDFELVKYYLKIGIDPNYQHPEYMALPLAECLRYDNLKIAELLLSNGANPNVIIAAVLEFIDSLALLLHWKYSSALLATSLVTLSYHHHATSIEMTDALVMRH